MSELVGIYGELNPRTSDQLVNVLLHNGTPRDFVLKGVTTPRVSDRREDKDRYGTQVFTFESLQARVEELVAGEDVRVAEVRTTAGKTDHFGHTYSTDNRTIMGSQGLPLGQETIYNPVGFGEFNARRVDIYRPSISYALSGTNRNNEPMSVRVTRYIGFEQPIDVFQTLEGNRHPQYDVGIACTGFMGVYEREIAPRFGIIPSDPSTEPTSIW